MSNVKKVIIIVTSILIVFFAGFFTGSFNPTREVAELEARANQLESKLDVETKRAITITEGLEQSNIDLESAIERIGNLTERNNKLEIENKRINEAVGNISSGIDEDKKRISGLIGEMDYYLNQGTE